MRLRTLAFGVALAAVAAAAPAAAPALGQSGSDYIQPKTSWGEPDLRGIWPVDHLNGTPLQRPEQYGDREFLTDEEYAEKEQRLDAAASRYEAEESENKLGMGHWAEAGEANRRTSLIVDPPNGRLPAFTEEGQRLSAQMRSSWQQIDFDWVTDFDTWDRCITRGMPASMFPFQYNNGMRVFQAPGVVAINMEMIHETRIIPTDGRPSLPQQISNWMGESRGHWEGDDLVVETTNLRPGPSATNIGTTGSPRGNDSPISPEAKITERFHRTGENTLVYTMTLDDPVVWTQPWTAHLDWLRDPDYGMFEYACHEGNDMIPHYITASRAQRAGASEGEE